MRDRKVVERLGNCRMIAAEAALLNVQSGLQTLFGFLVAVLFQVRRGEVVEVGGFVGALLARADRALVERFCLGVAAGIVSDGAQPVERPGDADVVVAALLLPNLQRAPEQRLAFEIATEPPVRFPQ